MFFTILFATILKAESCEFPTSDEAEDDEYGKDDDDWLNMYGYFARSFLIRSINSVLNSGSTSRNRRSSLSVVLVFFIFYITVRKIYSVILTNVDIALTW